MKKKTKMIEFQPGDRIVVMGGPDPLAEITVEKIEVMEAREVEGSHETLASVWHIGSAVSGWDEDGKHWTVQVQSRRAYR